MRVFLVRHGEAESPNVNPDRPLTVHGIDEVGLLASKIAEQDVLIDHIFHSGITRAKQTSEIIQKVVGEKIPLGEADDLLPESDPNIWIEKLLKQNKNIMLVGHMPFMAILGETLLKNQVSLGFKTASMTVLRFENEEFHFEWSS